MTDTGFRQAGYSRAIGIVKIVLPQVLDSLFAIFPTADCGFILLRDQQTGSMTPCACGMRPAMSRGGLRVRPDPAGRAVARSTR